MRFKIKHDRKECTGCASCVSICGEFWEIGDDGKSNLKGSVNNILELDDLRCNMEAAESCPVNCIHIFEDGKKKI